MTLEEQYLLNLFCDNFENIKNKRIAIYGIGTYSKVILENINNYNIIGVLDAYKTYGNFCGYNILDFGNISNKQVEIIIIVARSSSTKVIYNRISEECKKKNIKVKDIFGNTLSENGIVFNKVDKYFEKNAQELKKEIDKNEIITFDIFDTLLMRKTLLPEDVFQVIANKIGNYEFVRLRKECAKSVKFNIYDIYNEYQRITGIDEKTKNDLLKLEIEIEKSVIVRRNKMVEILEYAVEMGKKVYLISDMYFTKGILKSILSDLQITGYSDIFVSCEYGCLKSQGLYNKFKEKVKATTYLHIGDDFEADGTYAEINGLSVYLIKSAYDMLEISSYKEILNNIDNLSEKVILGIFVEKAFNNPFALYNTNGRLKITSEYDRGYLFLAPLITAFMIWLTNKLKNSKFDKILFAARDGYLINQLYNKTRKYLNNTIPEGIYFLTSRMASCLSASIDEQDLIYFSSYSYQGSPEDMLSKRFLLDHEDILPYNENYDLNTYILKHKYKILNITLKSRDNYKKYLENIGILNDDKLCFFDFVSSGTSHFSLNKLLNKSIKGFYFIHILSNYIKKSKLDIESFYKSGNTFEIKGNLYENYLFLEYVMASFKPSLFQFDEEGNPKYLNENRNIDDFDHIHKLQEGIKEFYNNYLSNIFCLENVSIEFADMFFGFMNKKYSNIEDYFSQDMILENEFSNKDFLLKGE